MSKIAVVVTAPEGLPEMSVTVACKPKNQAELDAVVEACGGPCAFHYFSDYGSHAKLPNGVSVLVEAYDGTTSYSKRPLPPSVAKLQAACKR
jgi:hypothetical protein